MTTTQTTTTTRKWPTGPTQTAWWQEGHQAALADVAAALESGGEAAVAEWLRNNRAS